MEDKSLLLKEKGNSLYKQEKFDEAIECYKEAASLQPKDPGIVHYTILLSITPSSIYHVWHFFPVYLSNCSAAQYELGKYKECVETIDSALSLVASQDNPPLETKLLLRKARACLYSNQKDKAKEAVQQFFSKYKDKQDAFDKNLERAIASIDPTLSTEDIQQLSMFKRTLYDLSVYSYLYC